MKITNVSILIWAHISEELLISCLNQATNASKYKAVKKRKVNLLLHCFCNSKEAPLAISTNKVLGSDLNNCLYVLQYRDNKTQWDRLFLGGQCSTFCWCINYVLVDRTHNTKQCIYCLDNGQSISGNRSSLSRRKWNFAQSEVQERNPFIQFSILHPSNHSTWQVDNVKIWLLYKLKNKRELCS